MEELLDVEKPSGKVFTDKNSGIAIFLGGAFAGGYIFSHNFKIFGEKNKTINSWIIAVVLQIIILFIAFSIPETVRVPTFIYFLIYYGIFILFYNKFQKIKVEEHLLAGGEKHHWSVSLLVGLIALALNFSLIYAAIYSIYGVTLF
jgi:hypothetical protein